MSMKFPCAVSVLFFEKWVAYEILNSDYVFANRSCILWERVVK